MDIKVCNSHFFFNTLMNNGGDACLAFDMRNMYSYLRGHIDYDHDEDMCIPLPCDYMLQKNLSIKDVY